MEKHICVACNEDGFGPSAFAFYLVRSVVELWREGRTCGTYPFELRVSVLNNSAHEFNQAIYSGFREVRAVSPRCNSLLRLVKRDGEVDVRPTLKMLGDYEQVRNPYLRAVKPYLKSADVAVDVGVPLFVRSASDLGVRHRITLFDHSWAATLRLMCARRWKFVYRSTTKPTELDRHLVEGIAESIEQDEKRATEVYLFPPYITPPEFVNHWVRLGFAPNILPGPLGGGGTPETARPILNRMFKELRQDEVPLGRSLVLVSPGGTQVWAEILPSLIEHYLSRHKQPCHIAVLSNPHFSHGSLAADMKHRMRTQGRDRIRWFEYVKGATQQVILPAFELIVSRAGGGIVNDALATGVRLACLPEAQVQVKLIERECKETGILPELGPHSMDSFREDPGMFIDCLLRQEWPSGPQFAVGAEKILAKSILSKLNLD